MKFFDGIPKSLVKVAFPIMLSANVAYSQFNENDSSIHYLKNYEKTFIANDFDASLGGIVYASKNEGLKNLTEKAKYDSKESAWAFLPEYSFWINTLAKVGEASGKNDVGLVEYIFDNFKEIEFWHTHTDEEYDSWFTKEEIDSFGPSLYFIPTTQDVTVCIQNTSNFPDNDLLMGTVSSKGCLEMKSPKMDFSLTNPYAIKAFNDFCRSEFISIRENFRGTPSDSLEIRASEYSRNIKLKYL
jgi:hypothetical protein